MSLHQTSARSFTQQKNEGENNECGSFQQILQM